MHVIQVNKSFGSLLSLLLLRLKYSVKPTSRIKSINAINVDNFKKQYINNFHSPFFFLFISLLLLSLFRFKFYKMEEKIETFNRNEERELVHKLDKRLLLFAMFGNLVKALDNSNLGK